MRKIILIVSLGLAAIIIIGLITQIIAKENSKEILTNEIILPYFPEGKQTYDLSLFVPKVNQSVTLDGVVFVYSGNSTSANQCKGWPFVNQTELKNFKVTLENGLTIKKEVCWPPPMWYGPSSNIGNGTVATPPLRYAISWFDKNYTAAVAYCDSNICPYGFTTYLVQKQ
ncbi:MAG: hypothetical protein ACRDFB_02925 [Rhabdochlamydiaceae bacterium]